MVKTLIERLLTPRFFVFGVIGIILVRYFFFIQNPWAKVVGDELSYRMMAFHYFQNGTVYYLEPRYASAYSGFLYPVLLSFIYYLPVHFFKGAIFLNALLAAMNSLIAYWGVFQLSRSHKKALLGATLVSLIPSYNFSAYLMAENLFLPIYLLVFFLFWFALKKNSNWIILCAFFSGVLFWIKPHALALIASIGIFLIAKAIKTKKLTWIKLLLYYFGLLLMTVVALRWLVEGHVLEFIRHPFGYYQTMVSSLAEQTFEFQAWLGRFLKVGLGLLSPFFILFSVWVLGSKTRDDVFRFLMLLLTLTWIMVTRVNAISGDDVVLHFRYLTPLIAPICLYFIHTLNPEEKISVNFNLKSILFMVLMGISFLILYFFYIRETSFSFVGTAPELAWLSVLDSKDSLINWLGIPILAGFLGFVIYVLKMKPPLWKVGLPIWVGVFLMSNAVIGGANLYVAQKNKIRYLPYEKCLFETIQSDPFESKAVFLTPAGDPEKLYLMLKVAFRLDLQFQYIGTYHSKAEWQKLYDQYRSQADYFFTLNDQVPCRVD